MRIDSSVVGMESARRYTSSSVQYSRFVLKNYQGGKTESNTSLLGGDVGSQEPETKEEAAGKASLKAGENSATKGTSATNEMSKEGIISLRDRVESMRSRKVYFRSSMDDTMAQFRHYTTRYIFMLLFGREKTNEFLGEEDHFAGASESNAGNETQGAGTASQNTGTATLEFLPMKQVSLTRETAFYEKESVAFASKGKVTTADGREISFNVEVGMSREFMQYYREEYDIAQFQRVCDPLVINLNNNVATLSDQKFTFDIDADGKQDEISMLDAGSGYLALDKNDDGVINDGGELFGPKSGNGFSDLAEYDEDGDGWIDEDDDVWSKLKVWCRDETGKDVLLSLRESGVGAICLQNQATEFALNNAENVSQGYLRSTGIFLYENGNVGTVQHLDLVQ